MAPSNALPTWGNEQTMNLNSMILTNIQSSPYFKVQCYDLKTFHEVIDEVYYKVTHLEPWERGSRKTAGQTGMCGGVRGVGAGGIVSSAYCLLYKLFTLKLTRKQVNNLLNHADSPYIRGLGFMYIRYTQPPQDLWEWFEPYLDDEEEIDVKAGGGHTVTVGEMCRMMLIKLDWYATLFPRIPVPVQKTIAQNLKERPALRPGGGYHEEEQEEPRQMVQAEDDGWGEAGRTATGRSSRSSPVDRRGAPSRRISPHDISREIEREKERQQRSEKSYSHDREHHRRSRSRDLKHSRSRERKRSRERHPPKSQEKYHRRSRSRDRPNHRSGKKDRHSSKEHSRHRSRSRSRDGHSKHSRSISRDRHSKHKHRSHSRERSHRQTSFERDLRREKSRHKYNSE